MKIILGLGNPGEKYEKTRHNVGFMILDRIKDAYHFPEFSFDKHFNAEISELTSELTNNNKVILIKPQTFMNNSGQSAKAVVDFYKASPEDLIAIHDDIDLPLGEYRTANGSGSAGHKGVQNIIDLIGTQDFKRIRIGVANENLRNPIDPSDFVLQKFSEEEINILLGNVSGNVLNEMKKILE